MTKLVNYFESLETLHVNTCPQKNYYIPFSTEKELGKVQKCQDSPFYHDLNGTWDFSYEKNGRVIEIEDYFGGDKTYQTTQTVPSVWQMAGFGQVQYTNVKYPIPYDPPYVPYDNPVGIYRRNLTISKKEKDYFLNFEGVDSCFYVYLNGEFVGFSQISHANQTFDVTKFLQDGDNELVVFVLKWCVGTYFEDQDKFRFSGIFRDVYLLEREKERLESFYLKEEVDVENRQVKLMVNANYTKVPDEIGVELFDPKGALVNKQVLSNEEAQHFEMNVRDAFLWSAETPYLYTLSLTVGKEVVEKRIGFRKIEIKDKVLYFNDEAIKIHGVNLHDSDPKKGSAVSIEDLKKDLMIMKAHNVNGIRTSHYPKAPEFYELCNEMGFYVMSEADVECHGVTELPGPGDWLAKYSLLAEQDIYSDLIVDRVEHSMIPFLNEPSIFMWSMGNESGYGVVFEKGLKRAKELDTSRPLHFESVRYKNPKLEHDESNIYVHSRMYPSLLEIEEYFSSDFKLPYVLCEYAHAMGNGPGDFAAYDEYLQKEKSFFGLFVWEWCDHAVDFGDGKLLYGGDNGEFPHDGNFCVDGLVSPNRIPHEGLKEFRQIYRPLRLVAYDKKVKTLTFKNMLGFTNARDVLKVTYRLYQNQHLLIEGILSLPDVQPGEEVTVNLPTFAESELKGSYLHLDYLDSTSSIFLGGDEVHFFEKRPTFVESKENHAFDIEEKEANFIVTNDLVTFEIAKHHGMITSIKKAGKELLETESRIELFRAPTDNDRNVKNSWYQVGFDNYEIRGYSYHQEENQLTFHLKLLPVYRSYLAEVFLTYHFLPTGELKVAMDVHKNPVVPALPRIGFVLPLVKGFTTSHYFGLGPTESYQDKKNAARLGFYESTISDFYQDHLKPQEHGERSECSYASFESDKAKVEIIGHSQHFGFNFSEYTVEELATKAHNWELKKSTSHDLIIDYKQAGIGSNSCGPALASQYQLDDLKVEFEFGIRID